jgi:hypothetical protein
MSPNPDRLEGLESWLPVGISTELPHSTELELRKLHRTRADPDRVSVLELRRRIPTS